MVVIDYVVLIGYFFVMAAIGAWALRRTKRQEDYFMGGRSFGKLLQTFAAFGAGTGAQDPILVGRTTWTSGLTGIWSVLMWLFVTPVYWITGVWYRRMRNLTLGDFFVERYESPAMGVAYTCFALAFCCMYLSTMFTGISAVAAAMFGVTTVELFGAQVPLQMVFVPTVAIFVVIYGTLGGLTAAYWTDLIQGLCIIVLSVLLIPFGLNALVEKFGNPESQTMFDGFRILHERLPESYFEVLGGPRAGEFPLHYIISLSLLAVVGIVVQPHFIVTGGGSAKTESNARIGLVTGNFLKRLCTVGWALTGLIILALLADSVEIAEVKDRAWGVASRELLGTAKLGLVGLMLACLIAALMSTADTMMLVCSALVVHNVYAPFFNPNATERTYVNTGRIVGLIVVAGSAFAALAISDVLKQYTMALELPIVFAAPFWIGMYWRRSGKLAAWGTIVFAFVAFFVAPVMLPKLWPALREDPRFTIATNRVSRTISRQATAVDVDRRTGWEAAHREALKNPDEAEQKSLLAKLGPAPPEAVVGELFQEKLPSLGGTAVFWRGGLKPAEGGKPTYETVSDSSEGNERTVVERRVGKSVGQGSFNLDFVLYQWMGVDFSGLSPAMLKTMRLPPRLIAPFVVLLALSWLTPRNSKAALDRFYVKMKTEVKPEAEEDQREMEASYEAPDRFDQLKLFPKSEWEFTKPSYFDVIGFIVCVMICFVMVGLLVFLVNLGG